MKAQINNVRFYTSSTDERYLKNSTLDLLKKSGFTVITYCEKQFDNFGFTLLFLLSESHFAVHTFPEDGRSYCELSSCVKIPFNNFKSLCSTVFKDIEMIESKEEIT